DQQSRRPSPRQGPGQGEVRFPALAERCDAHACPRRSDRVGREAALVGSEYIDRVSDDVEEPRARERDLQMTYPLRVLRGLLNESLGAAADRRSEEIPANDMMFPRR